MSKFNEGDVVQLNSGGPPMTVERFDPMFQNPGTVRCSWFAGGKRMSEVFGEGAVKTADPPDKSL